MLQKSEHFVAAVGGFDKFPSVGIRSRVGFDVFNQPRLMFSQMKVVIVLDQLRHFAVAGIEGPVGAPVFSGQKRLLFERIKTVVLRFVKMTGRVEL